MRILTAIVALAVLAGCSSHPRGTAPDAETALAQSCSAYRHFAGDALAGAEQDRLVADASDILDPVATYPVSMDPLVQDMFADAGALLGYVDTADPVDIAAAPVEVVRVDCGGSVS